MRKENNKSTHETRQNIRSFIPCMLLWQSRFNINVYPSIIFFWQSLSVISVFALQPLFPFALVYLYQPEGTVFDLKGKLENKRIINNDLINNYITWLINLTVLSWFTKEQYDKPQWNKLFALKNKQCIVLKYTI